MISTEELRRDSLAMTKWEQHRFLILVAAVITIALFMVSVALSLYNSSGAAQLDLSRPGYQSVRDQAKRDTTVTNFSSSGALDKQALDQFSQLYADQTGKVISVDSYNATALTEDSLQLLNPARLNDPSAGQ